VQITKSVHHSLISHKACFFETLFQTAFVETQIYPAQVPVRNEAFFYPAQMFFLPVANAP